NMLNELINPHTARNLPAAVLPTLRQILYEGLHNIYFFSIVIVALALIANHFEAKKVLSKEATQETDEEA
ncbi:MAG TPA: MFS transporter, partial [Lactobacillus sp.]|nr:MFS transporter [Lactobacillus sp.]